MPEGSTLVIVADGAVARFLGRARPGARLVELVDRNMRADLPAPCRDRPARAHDRFGMGRHAIDTRRNPQSVAEEQFLNNVAAEALGMLTSGGIAQLVLCAPPRALGVLRAALSSEAREKLTLSWGKDITKETPAEIDKRLKELHA
jgi:protein required for attachment to host cells